MPEAALPVHGGNVAAAAAQYGGEPSEYVDFSANIDPLGPPPAVVRALQGDALALCAPQRYPDPAYPALRAALAEHAGVDPASIVIANGSAALIDAAVRALHPKSCVLPVPAFSEYARALRAARCAVALLKLDGRRNFNLDCEALAAKLAERPLDLALLTNPHNPSGALLRKAALETFVERASALKTNVILDEAFIDYVPDESLTALAARTQRLVVIRSLTKFYALPGLRVGYAVAHPALAKQLAFQLPSWPVSTVAAEAARLALADTEHAQRVRSHNERARAAFSGALVSAGAVVYPSAANFLLLSTALPSGLLTRALAERERFLVRDCASFTGLERGGFLRVAVRTPVENERLAAALARTIGALTT
jgi:threonine-phosphate decarboxylase